jgi:hypothetical protein
MHLLCGLQYLAQNKIYHCALTPLDVLKRGQIYKVSRYWIQHNSQATDKAYFPPELLTSNDYFFDDHISKLDGERVSVYSLGLCVL